MNTQHFQIIITNQLGADQDKNLISQKLAALFKIDTAKAAKLLVAPRTVIKDNIDEATAKKYYFAIQQTGAHCEIVNKNIATDLPDIVEPPKPPPASATARERIREPAEAQREPVLSLVAREEKTKQDTAEKLATLQNASAETLCPECGTIRGSPDALCLHCGYNPNETAKPENKTRWIRIAAVIVVVIAGALLAGLPFIQGYLAQQKLQQDMQLAYDTRNQVAEFIERTGFFPNQNMDANLPTDMGNASIASIVIGDNGVMTVNFNPAAVDGQTDATLIFTPRTYQGKIVWNCMQGTLARELRPETCQN